MKCKILALFIITLSISGCNNVKQTGYDYSYFNTFIDIKLNDSDSSNKDEILDIFSLYDKLSDNYLARNVNNIYTINNTNDDVVVDPNLYELLETSFSVKNNITNLFDPLCGSLAKKWKESLKNKQILDEITINEELDKMSNTEIMFKGNNVIQRVGQAELDLGGIVKGCALDKVFDYLKSKQIKNYIINAGSSSILLGEKNNNDGNYIVELLNLKNTYLKLKNCFVSTSSSSIQGVSVDNVTYSHIINPLTGSAINENDAVIVIANEGYISDALSTALTLMNVDDIKKVESDNNIKTVVIKDGKIIYHHPELEFIYG